MNILKRVLRALLGGLFYIGVIGGVIVFLAERDTVKEEKAQVLLTPYNAQINRYLKKKAVVKDKTPAQGNVIFVDEVTRTVDKFSDYTISPYNLPKTPDDVDSVILHTCAYVQVGAYSNGSKALQQVCNFTTIAVGSGAWSNWGEFRGTMPPEEIKRKRGSTSDEKGGRAIYQFFGAGGLVDRLKAPP